MKYHREMYQERGALLVTNDSGNYKGWKPDDHSAAKKALASVDRTGIKNESDAQEVIDKNRLPPMVGVDIEQKVLQKYNSISP